MKELFMQAHDELIAELMEKYPDLTEQQAYDMTADLAYERMQDKFADMADNAWSRYKDRL